jgi:hemerythrin superfamily protein
MSEHDTHAETRPESMPQTDVIDLLRRQHGLIRDLFDEVEAATSEQRPEVFGRLVRLLAVHETAEEEIVHPYARKTLDGGQGVVDDRLKEEKAAKELLSRLDQMDTNAPEFLPLLDKLRVSVLEHARAEERYEFYQLSHKTSEQQRRAMAFGVKAAEALAPTHPHPGVESAAKNILMGTPVAMMDRVRDVIRQATRKSGAEQGNSLR